MRTAYTALKSVDDINDETDLESFELGAEEGKDSGVVSWWFFVSLGFVLLCVVLNLSFPVAAIPAVLYRPNMYIGLENMNSTFQKISLPERLSVFPHVFTPVSSADPTRVFPTDGNARITFNGLVSPGEPHVVINSNTSMIAQHRVQDYGLNRCLIVSTIPNASSLAPQNRALNMKPNQFILDVWLLDITERLDPRTLSWNTRPSRISKIAKLVVREGEETYSAEFDCGKSGFIRTYEFACEDGNTNCELEFIQGQPETKPRMAITVEQRPSIK